jgi:hypothetical protein
VSDTGSPEPLVFNLIALVQLNGNLNDVYLIENHVYLFLRVYFYLFEL